MKNTILTIFILLTTLGNSYAGYCEDLLIEGKLLELVLNGCAVGEAK